MKTSKKILSLVLAVIMIVCAVTMAYAEGDNKIETGDIIHFGSYPQSEVTDEELIAELNAIAPEWNEWTSYGYYSGTGNFGTMEHSDWMRYTDVTYNNNKYRGVKFTQYRPVYTYGNETADTYQDDNGYTVDTVYWFAYESILWRVLDPVTGLIMCETIIDAQPYSNTIYYNSNENIGYTHFNDDDYKYYASDYKTSSINQWLNDSFCSAAFTEDQMNEISTPNVVNSGYYTSIGTEGYEKLDSATTREKIFLLSYNDVRNNRYGFGVTQYDYDESRKAQGSDYAKSQGLYVNRSIDTNGDGNSYWLLRSAGRTSGGCCYVNQYGDSDNTYYTFFTGYGIRPALRLKDINAENSSIVKHAYTAVKTEPTCTAKGYTTYTSECGEKYVSDYVDAKGHEYNIVVKEPTCKTIGYTTYTCPCGAEYVENEVSATNHKDADGNYKCDFECGYKFDKTETEEPEPEKEMTFFEKIAAWFRSIFDKLFGWMKK